MKCQICHKNDAKIVFTQIVNNEKVVLHICPECARKKGLSIEIDISPPVSASVEKLLKGFDKTVEEREEEEIPDLVCDNCGLTFREFKKSGLFGCDRCHEAFGDYMKDILTEIHGIDIHEAEPPPAGHEVVEIRHELKDLRAKLKHSVEMENYELAAELRDRISELQKKKEEK
ncbi:MAG: UvrB/UvrC motif-containing protein [Candidatus Latescibacteria bacterium]|nr:UvrB/UvrC motif-containing protein [Candidatus Latescibacterota bacterium]